MLVFFTGTLWTETVYSTLLVAACWAVLWARDEGTHWGRGLLPGALLGVTVLFRGVASYMAPIFLLAMIWPAAGEWRRSLRARWRPAAAFLLAAIVTVAPYSLHASSRHGGFVVSDATLGHVAYLGNNDFDPVTFDYGIGQLTGTVYGRTLRRGRSECPGKASPVAHDRCKVDGAVAWVREHPGEFVARVPMRLAQLANPHSFLTRHVRWGLWPMPTWLKELLVAAGMLASGGIVLGGTVVAWARGRGPWLILSAGVVLYTGAVVAALYGLTRFRLPLEALWLVWLAAGLAAPRATWDGLRASRWRTVGALGSVGLLAWLMSWYALTGYPGFW